MTSDRSSEEYLARVEGLDVPPDSVVMSPWGARYFALSYAQRIEGRLQDVEVVDHRADFSALLHPSRRLYTSEDVFHIFRLEDFWEPKLGEIYLSSAAPGWVQMTTTPPLGPSSEAPLVLGDGIAVEDVEVRGPGEGRLHVVVRWRAVGRPTRDYSTFVHVSDRGEIRRAEDLVAQSDQSAPVYGWYPTTGWSSGEVVREDHVVTWTSRREPRLIRVGMYYRDADGAFVHLGGTELTRQDGGWVWQR
jgi:hypothetical protein